AVLATAGPLAAQQATDAKPGDRVRFVAAPEVPELVTGRLEQLTNRQLRVVGTDPASGSQRLYELSLADVSQLEVLRTRRHTWLGLGVGAGIGAASTLFVLSGFCDTGDSPCSAGDIARDGLLITVPAALVGALIGTLVKSEEWAPVALP
ncbi:MAG: hypothetical protein PVF05_09480, partial [Gemmatimonadales bacterium]